MIERLESAQNWIVPPGDGPRMSFEEFQRWYESGNRGEWVDGEVIPLMPPDARHQEIVLLLGFVLAKFARVKGLGRVIIAPFELRLHEGRSYREPDILFLAREHDSRFDGKRVVGAADLVVEVVSPSTVAQDRRNKMSDYAAAGIPEYWIVDPRPGRLAFEAFELHEDGYYRPLSARPDGYVESLVLPGFVIDPSWFAGEMLPEDETLVAIQNW